MSNYFNLLPDFDYVSRLPNAKISDYARVKNLFKRVTLREDIYYATSEADYLECINVTVQQSIYAFYRVRKMVGCTSIACLATGRPIFNAVSKLFFIMPQEPPCPEHRSMQFGSTGV